MKPLVSICIPTYNGESYIRETLESALNQSYRPLEIVVSDDASSDKTLAIIETFTSKSDIPVTVYAHQPKGIGANWNHCIEKAKGTYIKFLFQDDCLEARCIEKMVELMEADTGLGLVACKRSFMVEDNIKYDPSLSRWIEEYSNLQQDIEDPDVEVLVLDKSLFAHVNFFKRPLNKFGEPSTYMFRKVLVDKIGYYREDLKQILDYEFCYRILKSYKIAVLNEVLCKFRLHSFQTTQKNKGKDHEDYDIYHKLIENDYFWLLNSTIQLGILRRKFKFIDQLFNLKAKLINSNRS